MLICGIYFAIFNLFFENSDVRGIKRTIPTPISAAIIPENPLQITEYPKRLADNNVENEITIGPTTYTIGMRSKK